jgi:hypothetical protein
MIKLSFFLSCVLAYHFVDFSATPGNLASLLEQDHSRFHNLYRNFTFYKKTYDRLPIYIENNRVSFNKDITINFYPIRYNFVYIGLQMPFMN